MGVWIFEGSDSTTWIANNSPNSIELSGLTQGLSYIRLHKLLGDNLREEAVYTNWDVGDGESNEFTYGDDRHTRIVSAKLAEGGTIAQMHTQKAYLKRFIKTHNRGSADNIYLFNRYDSSAGAYETFYSAALSALKYVPVLLLNITYRWSQETNLKTVANLTVKEIWR
jgi:hypothetical protein